MLGRHHFEFDRLSRARSRLSLFGEEFLDRNPAEWTARMVRFDPAEKCQQGSDPPEIGPEEMDRMGKCQGGKHPPTTIFAVSDESVSWMTSPFL